MQLIFSSAFYFCVCPVGLVPFIGSNGFVHKADCLKRVNKSKGVLCLFNGKFLQIFSAYMCLHLTICKFLKKTNLSCFGHMKLKNKQMQNQSSM